MHACPSSDELQHFLDRALSAHQIALILAHVEDCYHCQQSLERLTVAVSAIREQLVPGAALPDLESDESPTEASVGSHGDPPSDGDRDGVDCPAEETASFGTESAPSTGSTDTADSDGHNAEPHDQIRNPSDWPSVPGYEVLEWLGEGGMGVVYKANQHGLKRLVALKMIRGGSQARPHLVARFRTEAEAVAAPASQHCSDLRYRRSRRPAVRCP